MVGARPSKMPASTGGRTSVDGAIRRHLPGGALVDRAVSNSEIARPFLLSQIEAKVLKKGKFHRENSVMSIAIGHDLDRADRRRRIWAIFGSSSGNLVEWYDFYAYAFTALYFAPSFFPSGNQTTQLLQTAAVFAIGFLMRPKQQGFGRPNAHLGRGRRAQEAPPARPGAVGCYRGSADRAQIPLR